MKEKITRNIKEIIKGNTHENITENITEIKMEMIKEK